MLVSGSILARKEGQAMTSAERKDAPIPLNSFSDIEKIQKKLTSEFPIGTSWKTVVERLVSSGVSCGPVEPYVKLVLPDGVTMSEAAKRSEDIKEFRVRCSTSPSWLPIRSFQGITIDAELDKERQLLLLVATPYYKHS
ncbi:hypothetical protein B0B52_21345 [Polaromonas sp. A23]|nr:hypothetical protein B0B52_21345 [Polaromonas sp. A23]